MSALDAVTGQHTLGSAEAGNDAGEKPGIGEPDKSAINASPPAGSVKADRQAPPVNAAALKLFATARPINEIIIHRTATPEAGSENRRGARDHEGDEDAPAA